MWHNIPKFRALCDTTQLSRHPNSLLRLKSRLELSHQADSHPLVPATKGQQDGHESQAGEDEVEVVEDLGTIL